MLGRFQFKCLAWKKRTTVLVGIAITVGLTSWTLTSSPYFLLVDGRPATVWIGEPRNIHDRTRVSAAAYVLGNKFWSHFEKQIVPGYRGGESLKLKLSTWLPGGIVTPPRAWAHRVRDTLAVCRVAPAPPDAIVAQIIELTRHPNHQIRAAAAEALSGVSLKQRSRVGPVLTGLLQDPSSSVVVLALRSLAWHQLLGADEIVARLKPHLVHPTAGWDALSLLAQFGENKPEWQEMANEAQKELLRKSLRLSPRLFNMVVTNQIERIWAPLPPQMPMVGVTNQYR